MKAQVVKEAKPKVEKVAVQQKAVVESPAKIARSKSPVKIAKSKTPVKARAVSKSPVKAASPKKQQVSKPKSRQASAKRSVSKSKQVSKAKKQLAPVEDLPRKREKKLSEKAKALLETAEKRQALNLFNKELHGLNILYSPVKQGKESVQRGRVVAKSKSPKREDKRRQSLQRSLSKQAKITPAKAKSASKERKPHPIRTSVKKEGVVQV